MLTLKLAWRNLFRNVRRTVLTVMLVALSLTALIVTDGMIAGIVEVMVDGITRTLAGDAQIHRRGFLEDLDDDLFIADPDPILERIQASADIREFAPRVITGGMIASSYNISSGLIYGVDAEREKGLSKIEQAVVEGEYLAGSRRQILLGRDMADLLEVSLGDRIVITVSEIGTGEVSQELFRLSGILEFGLREFDQNLAFINLDAAQQIVGIGGGVHEIALRFHDPENAKDRSQAVFRENTNDEIEALGWLDFNPQMGSMIEMSNYVTLIGGVILFLLASLGVINSLFMSIYERIYEFGIAKAIGTTPGEIAGLVLLEALLIALVSAIIGSILGYLANTWFAAYGIPLGVMEVNGVMMDGMRSKVVATQFTTLPIYVILLVLGAAIYPALFASRIVPAEALQRSL